MVNLWGLRLLCSLAFAFLAKSAIAQGVNFDVRFGIRVFKPIVFGNHNLQSHVTHNFFTGFNLRKPLGSKTAMHLGLFTNGVSYRFQSSDSPNTNFITMNYLGIPVQYERTIKSAKWSVLLGIEPKFYISGHNYTAEPTASQRIVYANNGIFNPYNLAGRVGFAYRNGPLRYFLQYSFDAMPFKTYLGTRIFDQNLTFGFTVLPIK